MAEDLVAAISALVSDMSQRVSQPRFAYIRITHSAVPGSMLDTPVLDEFGAETGERQLLVHPDDWAQIESHARAYEEGAQSPVLALMGVPVRKDPDV